jgi:N-acetylmuramoyl-L-alanine amidase
VGLFESPFTITSIACAQEDSLVRLGLTLTDSAGLTTTYQFPSFLAVFAGATVDTSARPGSAGCGVLESVEVMQVGPDVHVAARVGERIDTPSVRIRERGRRVEIAFRKRGRSKPVPDSVLYGRSGADTIGIVVIDPGHGGEDPGAVGPNGVREKDVTLAVGLALRDLLKKRPDLKVHMTRDSDTFVGLMERTKFANSKGADIFVSIHANAVAGSDARRKSVRGYKMYFLSQAKSEEDRLVAMQENAVVELERTAGKADYLQNLLTEMVSSEYLRESQDLSILLAESFGRSLAKVRQLHTGVGQANFYVLNGAFMPAVLVEVAFISHPQEEKLLGEASFQKDAAEAIFEAIVGFKDKYGGGR